MRNVRKIKAKRSLKIQGQKGITLLVLVVTIIVLLILAGITIGALTGENGIIKNARESKEQTEIANEKEILEKATVEAMGKNKYGNIEESELQSALNKETGDGKTEAVDTGEEFEVLFKESNRYYIVDKDGNVGEAQDFKEDKSPGDITIGLNGEDLPEGEYQIGSIEDLVVLSNLSRGKGNCIENGEIKDAVMNIFSGSTIKLMKDLNFNSRMSYADLSMTWSYDETNEAYIIDENSTQNLRDLLMDKNGDGFIPIGAYTSSSYLMFAGIFDGQNYKIQNLYENREEGGGLFNSSFTATIKNIRLTNIDITSNKDAGGITRVGSGIRVYNCSVSGNIKGNGAMAGIQCIGYGNIEIINCCNLANIYNNGSGSNVGGVIGYDDINGNTNIVNCYNLGELNFTGTYGNVNGIIGGAYNTGDRKIINSCSMGKIVTNEKVNGQNFYYAWGGATVELENCYYLDTIISGNVIANESSIAFSKNDNGIIENLNKYVEAHKNSYAVELYRWKLGEDGYPIFE